MNNTDNKPVFHVNSWGSPTQLAKDMGKRAIELSQEARRNPALREGFVISGKHADYAMEITTSVGPLPPTRGQLKVIELINEIEKAVQRNSDSGKDEREDSV